MTPIPVLRPPITPLAQGIASIIFAISGTAGYLMFGDNVSDAIMKDLLLPQYGFSIPLNQVATWMIVS